MRFCALLLVILSSCSLYVNNIRENVTYDGFVLKQKVEDAQYRFTNFSTSALDSLSTKLDEFGKCKLRLIIDKSGKVINIIDLKSSFSSENLSKIETAIKKTEWLPYVNLELSTTIFILIRSEDSFDFFDNDQRIVRDDELEEYGL